MWPTCSKIPLNIKFCSCIQKLHSWYKYAVQKVVKNNTYLKMFHPSKQFVYPHKRNMNSFVFCSIIVIAKNNLSITIEDWLCWLWSFWINLSLLKFVKVWWSCWWNMGLTFLSFKFKVLILKWLSSKSSK